MTIYEEHQKLVQEMRERHRRELAELDEQLRVKQEGCNHKKWRRVEDLFYALGETAPGKVCEECGAKRHVR